MTSTTIRRWALVGAMLGMMVGTTGRAEAALVFYTDRATWLAAAGTPTFAEDFEAFTTDTPFQAAPVALNGMTIRQEGVNANFRNVIDVVPPVFPPPSNSNVASLFTNAPEGTSPGTQVRITFSEPNAAFGFDSFLGSIAEGATLEVFLGTTLLGSQGLPIPDGAFLGYVLTEDETATSVRFRSTITSPGPGGEGFNIDNLAGVAVPEPSSLALCGIASLAGLGTWARRRRATNP